MCAGGGNIHRARRDARGRGAAQGRVALVDMSAIARALSRGVDARAEAVVRVERARCDASRRRHAVRARAGKRRGIGDILSEEFDPEGEKVGEGKGAKRGGKKAGDGGAQFAVSARDAGEKWLRVGNVRELEEKPIKALILANGNFCMVKYGGMVFITACNSTAYQYPLVDGELFEGAKGAAIRSPLDGTEYDLATGEVLKWCPQDNLMRKFLGGLKKAAAPVPLPVYPTKVTADGEVFTYFI